MNPALIAPLTDAQVVGLTLWAEARNQPIEGRIAIANVIRNRVKAQQKHFGLTPRLVCLKPLQFSCWNDGRDPNHALLTDTVQNVLRKESPGPILRECFWIAEGALSGSFTDNVRGSDHYLTNALLASKPPSWAKPEKVQIVIGDHSFLRLT